MRRLLFNKKGALTMLLFLCTIGMNAQTERHAGYITPSDTVIMIGQCGGQMFVVEKDYFLAQDEIALNRKELTITRYEYILASGADLISVNVDSNTIPENLKYTVANHHGQILITNVCCVDSSGHVSKLSLEFYILFV